MTESTEWLTGPIVPDADEPITAVIFRMSQGECIALFPLTPADYDGWLCDSYMEMGGHSAADPRIVRRSRLAKVEEYAELKTELESSPYFYRLRVLQRFPNNAYDVRKADAQALRARINLAESSQSNDSHSNSHNSNHEVSK